MKVVRAVDWFLVVLILLNVGAVIAESVDDIYNAYKFSFFIYEVDNGCFLAE